MKIPVYDQHEPLLANRSDEDYQIIMDLRALGAQDGQDEHFFSKLAALTPLPFEHLVSPFRMNCLQVCGVITR